MDLNREFSKYKWLRNIKDPELLIDKQERTRESNSLGLGYHTLYIILLFYPFI